MALETEHVHDIETILSHRYDQGWDLWTTPDKRILKGLPYSAVNAATLLTELRMEQNQELMIQLAELFFHTWQADGRFKVYPAGEIYPCQTAYVANTLCVMGYAHDDRIQRTLEYFLREQYADGGWRCNKFSFGRGLHWTGQLNSFWNTGQSAYQ